LRARVRAVVVNGFQKVVEGMDFEGFKGMGVSAQSLGWGFLGNVKAFYSDLEQKMVRGGAWPPSHHEFVAGGRSS
jgi:hypothetical protein